MLRKLRWTVIGLSASIFSAAGSGVKAADDHEARLSLYAAAMAGSDVAQQRCPGLRRNADTLKELNYYAGVFSSDEEAVSRDIAAFRAEIEIQYGSLGMRGWCEAVWKAFGSEGEMVRNVLVRVEPEPPPALRN